MKTLSDARDDVLSKLEEGTFCPCCGQKARAYRWSLYGTAALALVLLYRVGGVTEYVHTSRLKELGHKGTGDVARLRLWDLAENDPEHHPNGARSGRWRVTAFGARFIRGEVTIPRYAWSYDGGCVGLEGDEASIHDALGTQFSLEELLNP